MICIKQNFDKGKIVCLDLSSLIALFIVSKSLRLFIVFFKSMKSITIMPPMSLSLNCLAIVSAASKFTFNAASSWFETLLVLPLFTSIACKASVCWMITYPPLDIGTVSPNKSWSCFSIPYTSKIGAGEE